MRKGIPFNARTVSYAKHKLLKCLSKEAFIIVYLTLPFAVSYAKL